MFAQLHASAGKGQGARKGSPPAGSEQMRLEVAAGRQGDESEGRMAQEAGAGELS